MNVEFGPDLGGDVMFGYVRGKYVDGEFMESLLDLVLGQYACVIGRISMATCGPLVAMARNVLVENFLATDKEWLLCADTDIVFSPEAVAALRESADPIDRPVVSGVYYVIMNERQTPAMYLAVDEDGLKFRSIVEYPENAIFEVQGIGAGFMIIHRSVFEKIQKDHDGDACWFREAVLDQKPIGEDLSFCIRVAGAGFPIHVNTAVHVGHVKSVILGRKP